MAAAIKSVYKPTYPEKYQGDSNNIVCRSSWERIFCKWCDHNNNILKWASEEFSIPYVSPKDGRVHRYYPDYLIEVKETSGKIKKYIVEVKPKRQTLEPKKPSRTTKTYINEVTTYAVNQAKWGAAREFAIDNGVEFMIITEDQLGIKPYGTGRVSKKRHK
jgi:hypothetical protein